MERVRASLVAAGIRCEIRDFSLEASEAGTGSYPELWVESNADYHTAAILYASPLRELRQRAAEKGHAARR